MFVGFDVPDTTLSSSFFAAASLFDPGDAFPARMDNDSAPIQSLLGFSGNLQTAGVNPFGGN